VPESLNTVDGRSVLRMERKLAHPPEKVWRAVTEPVHLNQWFPFDVQADLRPGGAITFLEKCRDDGPTSGGTITALDPPRLFAFSWDTDHLRWELIPDGPGTLLVFTHTFDDHAGAASFAAGWTACIGALAQILDGRPVEPAGDMAAEHEVFVARLGLDEGSVRSTPEGWEVRFERQLTRTVEAVWAAIDGSDAAVGGPAPATSTIEEVPPGPVTAVEAPTLLQYDWQAAGRSAGRVRWELGQGTGHGARLVLTQTGPAELTEEKSAALAGWRSRIGTLAAELSAVPR
jgi:uncharacterized protein YndB with AHSA1/START domain